MFNPLNAQLNPICHLLALLEAHHILHFGRIRVKLPKVQYHKEKSFRILERRHWYRRFGGRCQFNRRYVGMVKH